MELILDIASAARNLNLSKSDIPIPKEALIIIWVKLIMLLVNLL